jgi:hypothetical protein
VRWALGADVQPADNGTLVLEVPTATDALTDDGLLMSTPGLVPLTVEVQSDDATLASMLTFVNRLPDGRVPDAAPLHLGLVIGIDRRLSIGAGPDASSVVMNDALRADVDRLIDVLNATRWPASVNVPPGVLDALRRQLPTVADDLITALNGNNVLAGPRWPLRPAIAAAAGQQSLYADWLRRGEDAADDAGLDTNRTVTVLDGQPSGEAIAMLRTLGTRLVVLTPAQRTMLGIEATRSSLIAVDADGTELPALVVDEAVATYLDPSGASGSSTLATVHVAAELLAVRAELAAGGASPDQYLIVMGTSSLGLPDPERLGALTALVDRTAALRAVPIVGPRATTLAPRVDAPANTDVDAAAQLRRRLDRVDELSADAAATVSMLGDQATTSEWLTPLEAAPSTAVSDANATERFVAVRDQLAAIRSSVVLPAAYSFNLAGPNTEIRVRLTNTSTNSLSVRVRLSSSKLLFPEGDVVVVLPPGQVTDVAVPVITRSNGKFPVALEVFPPASTSPLTAPVFLTANVNALTGLGTTVTGVALLLLASWWFRHWQITRRRRAVQAAGIRHPVQAGTLPPQ